MTVHLRRRRPGLRRLLAAGLLAGGAAVALPVLAPTPSPHPTVLVAAHDLAAGQVLSGSDLRRAAWAPGTVPGAAVRDAGAAVGRILSGPLTTGSPVTEAGLLGPGLLTGQDAGLLAVPVRLSEPMPAGLVRPGDRVDVLSGAGGSTVASDAVVLAAQPALVLGVGLEAAERLAQAESVGPLGLAVQAR